MYSVYYRIKEIQQPRGGYLPVSDFQCLCPENGETFLCKSKDENISPSLLGTTVDYLTRFILTKDVNKSFHFALMGAERTGRQERARDLCDRVNGLDSNSILAACELASYDIFYRNPKNAIMYTYVEPNEDTIFSISKMVIRSVEAIGKNTAIVMTGITFDQGYSELVSAGDADYLTDDTLWDMKVSLNKYPTSVETLQLLMYYVMGCHSIHCDIFKRLSYIAIFNPRYNRIYRLPVQFINKDLIKEVEEKVIGYNNSIVDILAEQQKITRMALGNQEWLTTKQAADLLCQPVGMIRWMVRRKYISTVKKGRSYLLNSQELRKWCDENKPCITFEKWHELGHKLYGDNQNNWKFKCPNCGRISAVSDHSNRRSWKPGVISATHKCITWYDYATDFDNVTCGYQYVEIKEYESELSLGGIVITDSNMKKYHAFEFADDCDYTSN